MGRRADATIVARIVGKVFGRTGKTGNLPIQQWDVARATLAVQRELMSCAGEPAALMALALKHLPKLVGGTGAVVEVMDGAELVAIYGTGAHTSVQRGKADVWRVRPGQPALCLDARRDERVDGPRCQALDVRSLIFAPLRAPGGSFGSITVTSTSERAFGQHDLEVLESVAGVVALRLELQDRARRQRLQAAEQRIAASTLRESDARFRSVFDDAAVGMAFVGLDGRWFRVNSALCELLGLPARELLARHPVDLTHADDRTAHVAPLASLLKGDVRSAVFERRYVHSSGQIVWAQISKTLVRDSSGTPLYFVAQIHDVTARKQAEERLREMATRDALTGLMNRREMDRVLDEEIARSQRHGRPLSVVMLDLDNFKQLNDTFGHQTGDRALRFVADTLLATVRTIDFAARYGGEELMVILPDTPPAAALTVAERIRRNVADRWRAQTGDLTGDLTVSAGVTGSDGGCDAGAIELIDRADRALYQAKRSGRNRSFAG